MSIDTKFNELLLKYHISDIYPAFEKKLDETGRIDYKDDDIINEGRFCLLEFGEVGGWDLCHVIYEERAKLQKAIDENERKKIYQRLIFQYLYVKDFVYAEKTIESYISDGYDTEGNYQLFWAALKVLFCGIKNRLKQKRDIINYWLDAMDYGKERDLPFLDSMARDSVYFEKAYSCAGYTTYALKTILNGMRPVDDCAYLRKKIGEDSKLISYLEKKGIKFRYCGFKKSIDAKYRLQRLRGRYEPSSIFLWDMLDDMEDNDTQCFYIIHCMETHPSWRIGNWNGEYYSGEILDSNLFEDYEDELRHRLEARLWLDEQLRFYTQFVGDYSCQIYMSDHGDGWDRNYDCMPDNCHTMLFVRDVLYQPSKRIHDFFTYLDYYKLMECIVEKKEISTEICVDHILVQNTDYGRAEEILFQMDKNKFRLDLLFGFRGVITAEDNYVLRFDGYERYRRKGDRINYTEFSEYQDRLNELRELAGTYIPDVYSIQEFVNARAVHRVLERYRNRVGKEEIGITLFKEYVDNIPDGKRIVIRGGGEHTNAVLSILGDRCERISYIVDQNTAVKPPLGIPLIIPEQLRDVKPDVVLISSLKLHKVFAEEVGAMNLGCEIFDIYDVLESRGIPADRGFYESRFMDEDFEGIVVGEE